MSAPLQVLPVRTAGAAENMATDFLMLQRWPAEPVPRFRHYDWRQPAFTFGYSQKIGWVRSQLPEADGSRWDLCRRPTGGGIVDHRDDWTYAVVVPRGHPWEEERATESYRRIHECLAAALRAQGAWAQLAREATGPQHESGPGVCFVRAEVHDVIAPGGVKIAGAAQKRNKQGLLFQGSIWKPAAGVSIDWDRFAEEFPAAIAEAMGAEPQPSPWPEFAEGELDALTERYSGEEWMEFR